jgi:hypothetical protein
MTKVKLDRDLLLKELVMSNSVRTQRPDAKLLELTIHVTKHQRCGLSQSSAHLWRLVSVLWRLLIAGSGEPDLVWANPGASLPLRVHSFATLLQIVGSTTMFLSRNGVTQLDGASGWDVVNMGKVLAALFDEETLFGNLATELLDDEQWAPPPQAKVAKSSPSKPKRRHVRQTYEIMMPSRNDRGEGDADLQADLPLKRDSKAADFDFQSALRGSADNDIDSFKSEGSSASKPSREVKADFDFQSALRASADDTGEATSKPVREIKVDSKSADFDFQSAFRASADNNDDDGFKSEDAGKPKREIEGDSKPAPFGFESGVYRDNDTEDSTAKSRVEIKTASKADFDFQSAFRASADNNDNDGFKSEDAGKPKRKIKADSKAVNLDFQKAIRASAHNDSCDDNSSGSNSKPEIKMDSKADFQNAFRASADDDDGFQVEASRVAASRAMIQSLAASGRGRFMTMPTGGLSTIREFTEGGGDELDMLLSQSALVLPGDPNALHNKKPEHQVANTSTRQMRVPNRRERARSNTLPSMESLSRPSIISRAASVPKTEDIENVGAAFLDSLGKSFGVR